MNPKHFDTEFYPTPAQVAGKMIAFSGRSDSLDKLSILDPSAGAGALLEAVKNRVRYHDKSGNCGERAHVGPKTTQPARERGVRK